MSKQKLVVFASGSATQGGGSGAENLFKATQQGVLDHVEIVAFVSQHPRGGVYDRAKRLGVPFVHFAPEGGPLQQAAGYQRVMRSVGAEWASLSGWLKFVRGLNPSRTINIHPALLSLQHGRFGGHGMYGHHVHEAVWKAMQEGELKEMVSGFSMHFVTESGYDRGPVFYERRVSLSREMSPEAIGVEVNRQEHAWQPLLTSLVLRGEIAWDGISDHAPTMSGKAWAALSRQENE